MKSRVSTKDNVRRIARNINELPKYEIETSFHSSLHTGSEYGYSFFFFFFLFFFTNAEKRNQDYENSFGMLSFDMVGTAIETFFKENYSLDRINHAFFFSIANSSYVGGRSRSVNSSTRNIPAVYKECKPYMQPSSVNDLFRYCIANACQSQKE